MSGNASFTTLVTTTLSNFGKEIFDNVVSNNALLNILQKSGNIKVVGGGRTFTHPLRHKLNSTFAARAKRDVIPLDIQDHITRSEFNVKVVDGSVALDEVELAMNAGSREKLIDLLEEVKASAEVSMSEVLGDQVFNTTAGANDLDGIPRLISTTPSLQSDVGGIDSTGNTYWRNQIYATNVTAFGTSQAGLNAMSTLYNLCLFGRQGPTCIITTKAVMTLYELSLTANARYTKMDVGDGGFKTLMYSTIPMYFDDNCPSGRMYFIDTNSMLFQVLKEANMKMTDFQQTQDQLTKSALMYIACNLTTGQRRTSGVINSITG